MLRLLMVLVVVSAFGVALTGCEEEGTNAAAEFGASDGRRPKAEKRDAPGPGGDGGFQQGDDNSLPPDQRRSDPGTADPGTSDDN